MAVLLQAAGHGPNQDRRSKNPEQTQSQYRPCQHSGHMVDHFTCGLLALLRFAGRQNRHESLAEGAFGKQATKQIRNSKRHIESVGQCAGAKSRGDQQFTRQPRHTRGQCE